ncbi:MAG: LysE family translocator [Cryobacterium sp.]|nr:LysE family translocator [Cryobacterium sp.]MBX3311256.1 LysE family translocator [Cryobacterium sp.]MCB1281634.1 LysE family translocator [Salinibacterium sp.]
MPSVETLAAFAVASVILVVIPGPSVLFVIGRSLSLGRRGGLMSVLGNALGVVPLIVAVAFGVGAVVSESIVVFTIIKLFGAAYLMYLGVQAIRHRHVGIDSDSPGTSAKDSSLALLRQGFIVGISNPKAIVFLVAVLPQFVNIKAGSVPAQMLVLGMVVMSIGLAADSTWALLAGSVRAWLFRTPRRLSAIRATGGGLLIALGGVLAFASKES